MFRLNLPDTFSGEFDRSPQDLSDRVIRSGLTPFAYLEDGGSCEDGYAYRIAPTTEETGQASSLGTASIPWHSDNSCLTYENRPDYLFLGCVENPGNTEFAIADIQAVVRLLPVWVLNELTQPQYSFHFPHSFSRGGVSEVVHNQPILTCSQGIASWEVAFNEGLTTSENDQAILALSALSRSLDYWHHTVILRPGQWVAFNNRRYVHRRGTPHPGRLLYRIYAQRTLESITLKRVTQNLFTITHEL